MIKMLIIIRKHHIDCVVLVFLSAGQDRPITDVNTEYEINFKTLLSQIFIYKWQIL